MSRYTGPRLKVMRVLGTELPGLSRNTIGARNHPPGQHGQRSKRKSGFGLQLIEKQKLRFSYGVTEGHIQRLFREAKRATRSPVRSCSNCSSAGSTTSSSALASRRPRWRHGSW